MPIIVNLDVMMAKRKISLGELAEKIRPYSRQSFHSENRKSQSCPIFYFGGNLQRTQLPAGRYIRIQTGRVKLFR